MAIVSWLDAEGNRHFADDSSKAYEAHLVEQPAEVVAEPVVEPKSFAKKPAAASE